MSRLRYGLTGLLLLQILFATGLSWHSYETDAAVRPMPLLDYHPADIDRIVIRDGQQQTELSRVRDHWQLPDAPELPLNTARIKQLLDILHAQKSSWPVSTSAKSAIRFAVAPSHYERHIQLYAHGQLRGDLYLGSSPSFRQVHIRRAGDTAVYVANLTTYDVSAQSHDWLDRTLIAVQNLRDVQGTDFHLQRQPDSTRWQSVGPQPEHATLDQDRVRQFISALTALQIQDVAPSQSIDGLKPVRTLILTDQRGQWTYTFFQKSDPVTGPGNAATHYYVQRNDRKEVFTLSSYDYTHIATPDTTRLFRPDSELHNDPKSGPQPAPVSKPGNLVRH